MQKWPKNHYLWRFLTENLKFRAHRDTFFRICWHISKGFGVEKTNAVVRFELCLSYQKLKKLCVAQKKRDLNLTTFDHFLPILDPFYNFIPISIERGRNTTETTALYEKLVYRSVLAPLPKIFEKVPF